MAISSQDIQNFLLANPGMTDAQIAAAMQTYNVTPTQLAAATATNGTKRPIIPAERAGLLEISLLKKRALPTPAEVAAIYAVKSCSLETPTDAVITLLYETKHTKYDYTISV